MQNEWSILAPNQLVLEVEPTRTPEYARPVAEAGTRPMPLAIVLDNGQVLHWNAQEGKYYPATRVDVFPWMFDPAISRPQFFDADDFTFIQMRRQAREDAVKASVYWFGQMAISVASLGLLGGGVWLIYALTRSAIVLTDGVINHLLPAVFSGLATGGYYIGIGLAIIGSTLAFVAVMGNPLRRKSAGGEPMAAATAGPAPGTAPTGSTGGDMHIYQTFVNGHSANAQAYVNQK